jgi:hypothetical protein
VAVRVERLFDAVVDESRRRSWLPDGQLSERTATRPRSARFDWGDEAERMKAYWRERVTALKEELER